MNTCKKCNYKTNDPRNWYRHLNSKLHIKNYDPKKYAKIANKIVHKFFCEYCKRGFTSQFNLNRHGNICKIKNVEKNEDQDNNKIKKLEKKINELEMELKIEKMSKKIEILEIQNKHHKKFLETKDKIIESRDKIIESKEKENEFKNKLIMSAGNIVQTSTSTLNLLMQYFNNAPILEPLKDYSIFEIKGKEHFIKDIMYYQKKGELYDHLAKYLIKEYKTEDPSKQSTWNTDTSRSSYINRTKIDNDEKWMVDKKGVYVSKIIINPLLDYIKKGSQKYMMKLNESLDENNLYNNKKIMEENIILNEIIQDINNGVTTRGIVKCLGPQLYFDKNSITLKENSKKTKKSKVIIEELNSDKSEIESEIESKEELNLEIDYDE